MFFFLHVYYRFFSKHHTKMVSFNCNSCGDVINKPKIKKHLCECRAVSFSCIDCNKIFDRNTIHAHTACISEDQKFQGHWKMTQAKKPKEETSEITVVLRVGADAVTATTDQLTGPGGALPKLKMVSRHVLNAVFEAQLNEFAKIAEPTVKALAASQSLPLELIAGEIKQQPAKRPREEISKIKVVLRVGADTVTAVAEQLKSPDGALPKLKMVSRHVLLRAFETQLKELAKTEEPTVKALAASQSLALE